MEDDNNNNNKVKEVQVQEEQGVTAPPDWVEMVQNLDVTLDAHRLIKL